MPTVDLPAHNIVAETPLSSYPSPTITGGGEALASTDTATGVVLSQGTVGFYVGSNGSQSGGTALGFGLWNKPADATVTSVRFVALAYREGGGPVPAGTYGSAYTNQPVTNYPVLMLAYQGDPYSGGYQISTIPTGAYGEAQTSEDIRHLIGSSDYVIAGVGEPNTGTFGLCPRVWIDYNYPLPNEAVPVHLAYLAIRITYDLPDAAAVYGIPPLRQFQRGDGLGMSGAPRAIQNNSRQASLRQFGFQ